MLNKVSRWIKRNPFIKLLFFEYIQNTGLTSIMFNGKIVHSFFFFGKELITKYKLCNASLVSNTIIYFKINRNTNYAIECIKKWIRIASEGGWQYVFVCDNDALKYSVLKNCELNEYFKGFLKSNRRGLKKVSRNLYTGNWENATYAHLTPFYHAKSMALKNYWCIDADDTMFLADDKSCFRVLYEAEQLAKNRGISAFSLDMWRSKTYGKHWSLGILFINDNVDFCKIFNELKNNVWMSELDVSDDSYNLDWFFTYLKDKEKYNIQSFYVEDIYFIHWSDDLLRNNSSSWINTWHDNKIIYPILNFIYRNTKNGTIDVADCIKIDINLSGEEFIPFVNLYNDYHKLSISRRTLLGII